MSSSLENASQGKFASSDWLWVFGFLILLASICFSIVLFGRSANQLLANETHAPVLATTPTAGLEPRAESAPEVRPQSVTAVALPETHSESTTSSIEALSPPIQQPLSRKATEGPPIAKVKTTNTIRRHRTYSVRLASHRRSAVDKVVLKTFNTLAGMWRRTFDARK
ncbi:MAG TPA: hypothetical protein VGY91_05055 [Chthoniobacterales bacterium]|jgi:hypothetical protein|nr:hypothetical protein [Chthoniobacterales bacterium]